MTATKRACTECIHYYKFMCRKFEEAISTQVVKDINKCGPELRYFERRAPIKSLPVFPFKKNNKYEI